MYPNGGIYTLLITNLPGNSTSAQLTDKYHNKDNIIQVAIAKSYDDLIQELDQLYDADKALKIEMRRAQEMNAQPNIGGLSSKVDSCAAPVLAKLRQNLTQASFPTKLGFLTFATIKSKHRFLEKYRDTRMMDEFFLFQGVRIEVAPAEDPKNYLVANWGVQSNALALFKLWGALILTVLVSAGVMLVLPMLRLTGSSAVYIKVLVPALWIAGGNFLLRWLAILLAPKVRYSMLVGPFHIERGRKSEVHLGLRHHGHQHSPHRLLRQQPT